MNNTKILLGKRIKELRKSRNFTQEQLSEMIDVDPKYISFIETGKRTPSIETLSQIAKSINVDLCDFFDNSHQKNKDELIVEIVKKLKHTNPKNVKLFYNIINDILNVI